MRILVALSGGVDSAVAAARLLREGAEVVAAHLETGWKTRPPSGANEPTNSNTGCRPDDARDAEAVAESLGIPFHLVDVADAFGGVVDAFVAAYVAGRTPNPCVVCNRDVKFGRLLEVARSLGCDGLATGHYARRQAVPGGRMNLLRARDPSKDQSYVLYALTQEQLRAARFPLGDCSKADVRSEARSLGLVVASKADSQDLCFTEGGDYRDLLRARAPEVFAPGDVVDDDDTVLGTHAGTASYTIGQRRGLPAAGRPRYVTRLDPSTKRVYVASRASAMRREVHAGSCNWIRIEEPALPWAGRVEARTRSTASDAPARLDVVGEGRVRVLFDEAVFAPAPGQALVAYDGDAVLCGGTIHPDVPPAGPGASATRC